MKILDRYILTTYLKTFFSVFTILMMIFILQSVWVYISELAGKDLEIEIVLKFLLYVSPRIVVLVLPLTILLASIMVFGGFSENYEFAAMKSTGISLQRAMKSLSVFIIFLAVISFFFANSVIPFAEFNFYSLRRNIAKVKPAMAIAEGQFNQLNDINIKVAEKSGENGEFLKDVIIHQKKEPLQEISLSLKQIRVSLLVTKRRTYYSSCSLMGIIMMKFSLKIIQRVPKTDPK